MTPIWTTLLAIGAAQGIFLCSLLLVRRTGNATATRLLASLVALATTMILLNVWIESSALPVAHLLTFLNINTELAFGPLVLFCIRALVTPSPAMGRRLVRHFIPVALAFTSWTLLWLILASPERRFAFLDGGFGVPLYMLLKLSWSIGYVTAAYRVLRASTSNGADARGRRRRAWLRNGVLALGAMVLVIYTASFAERFGLGLLIGSDPFASLLLAILIYAISAMLLQEPWMLSVRPRSQAKEGPSAASATELRSLLGSKQPWRDPELSLGDLAAALGWSETRLTTVIRDGLDTSFYALLGRYRLAEFERLARDPATRDRSVLELAYEAGFNSKAAFYRAFRGSHQTTPTAFRKAF